MVDLNKEFRIDEGDGELAENSIGIMEELKDDMNKETIASSREGVLVRDDEGWGTRVGSDMGLLREDREDGL